MKFFYDNVVPLLKNQELNVVDVGARNGFSLFPESLSKYCNLYGYEPNPEEFTKLIEEKTDLQLSGATLPKFKNKKYSSTALTNNKGTVDFFVTNGPGACNLMGETNKKVTENMFLDVNKSTSYEQEHVNIKNKITVETDKLDNIYSDTKIDFLKIDTEGMDYYVLEGAKDLFLKKKILFVKTEVIYFSHFKKFTPLLGDQMSIMRDLGYRCVDLDINHSGYLCKNVNYPLGSDKRPKYAGDAYFIPEFDAHEFETDDLIRLSIILAGTGYYSLSKYFLMKSKLLDHSKIDQLYKKIHKQNYKKNFLYNWNLFPIWLKRKIFN
jgi:FkbM family methyltransferase